ncbi:MAG: efflux RND transporter periplasmic adaptor subunit [Coriobacteriia bacterium]|nr:efflux RND transporter periplasmic adaptor subunit [Coriobacteriia bacterium]
MKKRIPAVIALLAIAGAVWWGYSTYLVGGNDDTAVLGGSGTIEADEVSVSPLLAGRIAEANATEGAHVAEGDVLFTLDSAIVDAQVAQAEAGVRAAQAALAQVTDDDGTAAEIAQATARVDQAQAMLAMVEAQQAYTRVTAPVDGTLTSVVGAIGENTAPGKTLATIADLANLNVSVYIPETRIGEVHLGQKAIVYVDSSDTAFNAVVTFISNQAEFTPSNVETREQRVKLVYEVRLRVTNSSGVLKPGMPADVEFR